MIASAPRHGPQTRHPGARPARAPSRAYGPHARPGGQRGATPAAARRAPHTLIAQS